MQVLPILRSHKEYIKFVQQNLKDEHIPKAHDDVPDKLKLLDLTPIRLLALSIYKDSGRPAFAPEDMMRTFVAMTLCGITSPTDWVNDYLKDKSGFYAIISGFMPGDIPLGACMTLSIGYSIYLNTVKRTTSVIKERNSPEPKKTAKG
jgi:hypothetical protein